MATVDSVTSLPASVAQSNSPGCARRVDDFWVPGALCLGIIVGLVIPSQGGGLGRLSELLGWTYFCAWSVSFYPQVVLNHRRRSVNGLSLDYQMLNVVGFCFYFLFNMMLYFMPGIRAAYRDAHDGHDSAVQLNDVVFSGHAFLLTAVTLVQIGMYYDYPTLGPADRLLRRVTLAGLALCLLVVAVVAIAIAVQRECCQRWLTFLTILTEVKVLISVIKYCPQVWTNFRRKSTEGWTIYNVLLDFSGGLLSVAQLLVDAIRKDDWSAITGDPAKLLLGNVSVFFDLIFMIQHYCLYAKRSPARDSGLMANC
mmetsp:Transcript_52592/g.94419  ORF Transcript_52592/g.94419 Transcript_52592/m.94419 type:complete len:311 (+) Transcript_52592:40-972(+)